MDRNYRTIILENENLVREGVRLLLSKTPFAAEEDVDPHRIDAKGDPRPLLFIVVLGREETSIEQVSDLRRRYPDSRIVVLTDDGRRELLPYAVEAGANAALLTSISPDGLIKTLHALVSEDILVVDGSAWPSAHPVDEISEDDSASVAHGSALGNGSGLSALSPPHHGSMRDPRRLSAREYAILSRIVEGDSNKHIARHFDIAEATVKAHVKAILRKIGVANRTQAAIWLVNNTPPNGVADSALVASDHDADADILTEKMSPKERVRDTLRDFRLAQSN